MNPTFVKKKFEKRAEGHSAPAFAAFRGNSERVSETGNISESKILEKFS